MKCKVIVTEVIETEGAKYPEQREMYVQVKEMTDADVQRVILAVNNIKAVEK